MRIKYLILLLFFSAFPLTAEILPEWFLPFSDAVYDQVKSRDQITRMYTEVMQKAVESYSGYELYTLLSRCEYTMGLSFRYEGKNNDAASFYERGIGWAEKSLAEQPSSEAYQVLAVNIALACQVMPLPYIIANGHNIDRYAKNVLKLDPRNVVAQYLLSVLNIYSPAPFNNPGKGLQMLEDLYRNNAVILPQLSRECRFNLFSAMAFACHKLKKQEESRMWLAKALEVHPTNKYVKEALR
jgi:tetratricopeptide (TPR) repeat protein